MISIRLIDDISNLSYLQQCKIAITQVQLQSLNNTKSNIIVIVIVTVIVIIVV